MGGLKRRYVAAGWWLKRRSLHESVFLKRTHVAARVNQLAARHSAPSVRDDHSDRRVDNSDRSDNRRIDRSDNRRIVMKNTPRLQGVM